ncbi:MAG: HAD-IA family hydrolase [Gammaproteobacteria bacterium]|nr:HAD-IA family hydrolase [Gammaproteobacteria bacterium]
MIQFHRRLRPVKIISFDLDDTLYDNEPVMLRAEQALLAHLHTEHPQTQRLQLNDWRSLRDRLAASDSTLASNMTALRLATLSEGLVQSGVAKSAATAASEQAMAHFLSHRNDVDIAAEVHQLLAALAGRFPLLAISNGNADIQKLGLQDYFTQAWQPSPTLRGKPTTDMFEAARQDLGFAPAELLHIGDHPVSDVQGAARFGAQSVWLNESGLHSKQLTWLPTVTITHLPALQQVLDGH